MVNVIAEMGINHLGNVQKAKKMLSLLSASGINFVKFQYRSSQDYFTEDLEMGSTLIRQELTTVNLSLEETVELCEFARRLGLQTGVSFFRLNDLKVFHRLFQPDFIKIPSPEAMNYELILHAQESCEKVIVSTGGLAYQDIEALSTGIKFRQSDCIMHCVSNYPSSISLIRPEYICAMRKLFGCDVGYSSHDENWQACLLYLPTGISFIERHYCEDKTDKGLDITTSSTISELVALKHFCSCRDWSTNYDLKNKDINQGELQNIKDLGSGYYFDRDYKKSQKIDIKNLIIKSPCRGVKVGTIKAFSVTTDVRKDDPVTKFHTIESQPFEQLRTEHLNSLNISLPIRLHDALKINQEFQLENYEWHLSYKECSEALEYYKTAIKSTMNNKKFSIHLPDYINSRTLIDPNSSNQDTKLLSRLIVKQCAEFANHLQQVTGNEVPLVGSFSALNTPKKIFYSRLSHYLSECFKQFNVQILPQFLPKQAWYFGGSVQLNTFCSISDIDFFSKLPFGICLDTAHVIMAANFESEDGNRWINQLLPLAKHAHLSDARGLDGEGVPFGSGELDLQYTQILNAKCIKVVEQWEGHLHGFEGFKNALAKLQTA